MSNQALNAAWPINVKPAARKLVLIYLANAHNGTTGQLNPSINAMARACGMSTQQARRHVHELIDAGIVEVIGNHNGGAPTATRNYKLNLEAMTTIASDTPITDDTPITGDRDPYHPRSRPLSPMTVTPITGDSQNRKKQKETEMKRNKGRVARAEVFRPDDVLPDVWGDFLAIRKAKRAPLTETALNGIKAEAAKAGMNLQQALQECCTRGWQSFRADWVSDQRATTAGNKPAKFDPVEYLRNKGNDNGSGTIINVTPTHTDIHSVIERINYQEETHDGQSF